MTTTPAQITLFNTLSRELEEFSPCKPGEVRIYCCGPTVYGYQHIGNFRCYLAEDFIIRALRYAGYKVQHVMNITDVGHLVGDVESGEDKMALAARREGKRSADIAAHYTAKFFSDWDALRIVRPNVVCKATEHIPEMIALTERLVERGYAYEAGGNVYFDVSKFPTYGELARLNLETLKAGARIDVDSQKRNWSDFALWFTKSKFENQELQWDSPWGRGYPGWHIECSAMSMKYLGEELDIHCGGIDHIPVHHTNEVAQSEGATGKKFSRYWMHVAFLNLGDKKMAKSDGKTLLLDELIAKGIEPAAFRLFCLGASYRRELAWNWEAAQAAQQSLEKIRTAVLDWRALADGASAELSDHGGELQTEFDSALYQDFNSPRAIAVVHRIIAHATLSPAERLLLLERFDAVLGLGVAEWRREELAIPTAVRDLLEQRNRARTEKRWADADLLRQEILLLGFAVEDSAAGPTLKRSS